MKRRRILVVGGLAAGPSAAAKAVRANPSAEVTVFEATQTVSYGICESPYAISGIIADETRLLTFTPERLAEEKGIVVKTLHLVEKIIPARHRIQVRDLRRHSVEEYEYDKLILATGASPKKLGVEGEDARNVFTLSSREDTVNIIRYVGSESPKHAVVVGGGYVGMEMTEALRSKGLDVTLLLRHRLPMSGLELTARERVLEELEKNGVHVVTNARTEMFQRDNQGVVRHVLTDRGTFDADLVLVSVGVAPNISLARQAKVKLGQTGAIVTDERQQTSTDDIYAAGDCCEVKNIVNGKPFYQPLATTSSRTGWVAGENAAGGRAMFKGAIRALAVKIFGLEVAHVGLSSEEARQSKFQTMTDTITSASKIKIMPDASTITLTMIVDRRSKRLVGANVYGGPGAVLRADALAVAIQHKLTVDDIARLDLIYAPPFSPLWDPILVAANQAKKKIME